MKSFLIITLCVVLSAASGGLCFAGDGADVLLADSELKEMLSEATEFFRQGVDLDTTDPAQAREYYSKALLRFERIVQNGVRNGKVFYNIGNVHYQLGDVGRAVLNYRRAQVYMPDDQNLQENLSSALSKRRDLIEEKQEEKILKTLFFWHYDLSLRARLIIFGIFYILFFAALSVRIFKREWFTARTLAVLLLPVVLFGGSLLAEIISPPAPGGVLTAREVIARKGDGVSYQPSFTEPLHAGTDFILIEDRGSWFHIELRDGRRCWVPGTTAALI